jgi:hypothetical protein
LFLLMDSSAKTPQPCSLERRLLMRGKTGDLGMKDTE